MDVGRTVVLTIEGTYLQRLITGLTFGGGSLRRGFKGCELAQPVIFCKGFQELEAYFRPV